MSEETKNSFVQPGNKPRVDLQFEMQMKRLKRTSDGRAVVVEDKKGAPRYLYDDNTLDPNSIVDHRNNNQLAYFSGKILLTKGCEDIDFVRANRLELIHEAMNQVDESSIESAKTLRNLGVLSVVAA